MRRQQGIDTAWDEALLFPAAAPSPTAMGRVRRFLIGDGPLRKRAGADLKPFDVFDPAHLWHVAMLLSCVMVARGFMLGLGSIWHPLATEALSLTYVGLALSLVALLLGVAWTRNLVVHSLAEKKRPTFKQVADAVGYVTGPVLGMAFALLIVGISPPPILSYEGIDGRNFIKVTPDGTGVVMAMRFDKGVTDRLRDLLDANPGVRTLYLESGGGRSSESTDMARLVRERGLDTVVISQCASACTHVHASGRRRTIPAYVDETLGYHGSYWQVFSLRRTVKDPKGPDPLIEAGIDRAFVEKGNAFPPLKAWYPGTDELLAANAIDGTYGRYDAIGIKWLFPTPQGYSDPALTKGWLHGVLSRHAPKVLADTRAWSHGAFAAGRNGHLLAGIRTTAMSRVLAAAIAGAPDHEVRKAGAYLAAGLQKAALESYARCTRIGQGVDLISASVWAPNPPGSASDPEEPWERMLDMAFGKTADAGWPGGIGLPDVDDPATWAARHGPPISGEGCGSLVAWFRAASDIDNPAGVSLLRRRFAQAAGIGDAAPGTTDDRQAALAGTGAPPSPKTP